jgi:leader peptidase (prepilin peptidase)/N-methyltransferase
MIAAAAVAARPLLVAAGAVAGLIVGSFVGALSARWPRGESVVRGRSQCDACGRWAAGSPTRAVLSFVACAGVAAIAARRFHPHLAAELACALVGATAFAAAPPSGGAGGRGVRLDADRAGAAGRDRVLASRPPDAAAGDRGVLAPARAWAPPARQLIGAAAGFGIWR